MMALNGNIILSDFTVFNTVFNWINVLIIYKANYAVHHINQ